MTFPGSPIPSDPAKLLQLPGHKTLAKLYPPQPGTILDHGIRNRWPTWLVCALQEGRPVNQVYTAEEIEKLAREIAGLPLGRKQPFVGQLGEPPKPEPPAQDTHKPAPAAPAVPPSEEEPEPIEPEEEDTE